MTKIEMAKEAMIQFEQMEFYRKLYNGMTEEKRKEISIGGRTVGEYALANYEQAKARWEYCSQKAAC